MNWKHLTIHTDLFISPYKSVFRTAKVIIFFELTNANSLNFRKELK